MKLISLMEGKMARVQVINEICDGNSLNEWSLCFQFCRYIYDDGNMQEGYRFIWRRPEDRSLQAARGQARIPSIATAQKLMQEAIKYNWGNYSDPDYKI